jgi:hypothetical protein
MINWKFKEKTTEKAIFHNDEDDMKFFIYANETDNFTNVSKIIQKIRGCIKSAEELLISTTSANLAVQIEEKIN